MHILKTNFLIIFFIFFWSCSLFAKEAILIKPKAYKAPCSSAPNLFGCKDQCEYSHTLTSYNNDPKYFLTQLEQPFLHTLFIRTIYTGKEVQPKPEIPDESNFLIKGAIHKIPYGKNYLAFIYDDLLLKRSFLLGLYSFSTTPHLVYMTFKNELIYYEPYLCGLVKIQEQNPKQFNLIFYFKEKDNGLSAYQKEFHFFDFNNDNKIDLIKVKEYSSGFNLTSKTFYQGPEYLNFLGKKYKKLLHKTKNTFIAENEMGIFSFIGQKEKIKIIPLENKYISFLFKMGDELMKNYEDLNTTYLSQFDKELRETIMIDLTSIQ